MLKLNHTKAIVFDFDGTLAILNIDFSSMRDRIFDLMKRYSIREEMIREHYMLEVIDEVYQVLYEENTSGAETFYQESHQILHEVEMRAAENGNLIQGTKSTLEGLREKGIKIGIITRNCEEAVRTVFPNINDFCDVFVPRNSVKKVKPHPDHLIHVLNSLDISGEDAVMVGDHIIDIQAGKRVGMKTIGVLTGRTKREEFEMAGADRILREVSEICGLLEEP
jgi:phosphoglycolate phosphatase